MATRTTRPRTVKRIRRAGLYVLMAFLAAVSIVPLYWMVRSSLMSNSEIFIFPPRFVPRIFRWDNYVKAFQSFPLLMYLGNTMTLLVPSVIGTVLTSAMCGYALARIDFPGKRYWFVLVVAAMILPGHVTLIPTYITWSKLQMVNTYVPFYAAGWLGGGASNIFLMRQFMRTLPKEYDEAAIIDGCGYVQIFTRVLLPLIAPIMITVGIFSFMFYWNDFQAPLIYLHRDNRYTLALGLMRFQGSYTAKWHYLMAASTVMLAPAILLFGIGQKYFINGIILSGIKG